ncbi:hypothetical protein FRC12_001937 [Ceratobasidium sp. 428]|nr:hypothetical protein FRC12_001937 [Ceratobasidium sp. 428]
MFGGFFRIMYALEFERFKRVTMVGASKTLKTRDYFRPPTSYDASTIDRDAMFGA